VVRTYKRKRDPRGRMLRAVELRAQGKSLREIAASLGCHHDTVWRDLKKWDAENATVIQLSDSTVGKMPPRGENPTPESDSSATVIPLRKATHG
jgi:transposase